MDELRERLTKKRGATDNVDGRKRFDVHKVNDMAAAKMEENKKFARAFEIDRQKYSNNRSNGKSDTTRAELLAKPNRILKKAGRNTMIMIDRMTIHEVDGKQDEDIALIHGQDHNQEVLSGKTQVDRLVEVQQGEEGMIHEVLVQGAVAMILAAHPEQGGTVPEVLLEVRHKGVIIPEARHQE